MLIDTSTADRSILTLNSFCGIEDLLGEAFRLLRPKLQCFFLLSQRLMKCSGKHVEHICVADIKYSLGVKAV